MFINLLFLGLSLLLAFIPAIIIGVFGGMLLQVFGIPYGFGYWVAAIIGYVGSVIALMGHFVDPQPSRAGARGFIPGFILGRLLK